MSRLVLFGAAVVAAVASGCTPLESGGPPDLALPADLSASGDDLAGDLAALPTCSGDTFDSQTREFCTGFETPLTPAWTPVGPGGVLSGSVAPLHGARSLELDLRASTSVGETLQNGVGGFAFPTTNPIWVRVWVYLPAGYPNPMPLLRIAGRDLRVESAQMPVLGNHPGSGYALQAQTWTCLELAFSTDHAMASIELYANGVSLGTDTFPSGADLTELTLGAPSLRPPSDVQLWLDDLRISATRPGCPL